MINLRPILLILGVLLATLGSAMMVPALYDLTVGNPDWQVFAFSAVLTVFVGVGLAFANRGRPEKLTVKEGFLLTNLVWVALTAFGALPLYWSELDLSFTDAFFEAMSGITTTGSTVMTGLDQTAPGILLWRALLQWIGGLGIIVMAISVFPLLQVGGMQLFKIEAKEIEEKVMPRAVDIARWLALIYVGLTLLCGVAYYAVGMTAFDAVIHAMTTLATGGFSSHDASIAYFSNVRVELVGIVFMCAGGLPFLLYVQAVRGRPRQVLGDSQMHWYFGTIAIFIALAWIAYQTTPPQPELKRMVTITFNVVSVMTTTGYATTAYDNWGGMAMTVFFILMFVGGCQGSTSGGIKIFRIQVIFEMISVRVKSVIYPHGVFVERYNDQALSEAIMSAVMAFFFLYLLSFAVIATLLGLMGLDPVTALSSSATAISNVGPGLGPIVGPVGNFLPLPDAAKWLLCFAMLLGRLEVLTVMVLMMPVFWRA